MSDHRIPLDPDPPTYKQTGFKIWQFLPKALTGLFVVLLAADGFKLAYLGPFVDMTSIIGLVTMIFWHARNLGATYWEIIDNRKGKK